MSDAADSPIWSGSSDLLCSYSSRANDSCCLEMPYPTEPGRIRILLTFFSADFYYNLGRDFLPDQAELTNILQPQCNMLCSHEKPCICISPATNQKRRMYSRIKQIPLRKPPLIHVIIFPASFPFPGDSPRKVGLHNLSPCIQNCFRNMK